MPSSWSSGMGSNAAIAAGTGAAAGTGVCICRKLGSFWNSVIFSAIGVGGGDGA